MKGRPPKPLEQRRREGNPGKRPLPEPVVVGGRFNDPGDLPECPDHLDVMAPNGEAVELWRKVGEYLIDANVLAWGDLFVLEAFIESELVARQAYIALADEGFTVRGDRGTVRNPMFTVWRDARTTALRHSEHLGLSPVARARLGLAGLVGRKLERELGDDLPDNPLTRQGPDEEPVDAEVIEEGDDD